MNSIGLLLKRLARSETANLSIWVTLLSLAVVAAAGLYYAWRLPETLVQEETRLIYTQNGVFDYRAFLKPNTVYGGVTELEPRPSFFAILVESLQMKYTYQVAVQDPAGEVLPTPADSMAEYEVVAILSEGELWTREYILVPHRLVAGTDLDLEFALPIQAYFLEAESIRAEVNTPGRDVKVEVQVRIWPNMSTESGLIRPAFVHSFGFRWQDSELMSDGSLSHEETNTLGESITVPHPQRGLITEVGTWGLGVSLVLLVLWAGTSMWAMRVPFSVQQMTSELHRRYGDVIVEAVALPPTAPHQIVVHLRSLEDIGRTAHELMKPIIVVDHEGERHYVVIDGADNVRYEVRIRSQTAKPSSTRTLTQDENDDTSSPYRFELNSTLNGSTSAGGTSAISTSAVSTDLVSVRTHTEQINHANGNHFGAG